jgi:hypothetical protein
MADQDLGSVLALVDKLSSTKEMKELLGDLSTGIGDLVALAEENPKKNTEMIAAALSAALAKTLPGAMAAALAAAVKGMPAPQVQTTVQGATWKTLECEPEYDHSGRVKKICFTRK